MCQFLLVPGPPMLRTFLKKNWYKIGAVPSRKRRIFGPSGRLLPTFPGSSPGSPVLQRKTLSRNRDLSIKSIYCFLSTTWQSFLTFSRIVFINDSSMATQPPVNGLNWKQCMNIADPRPSFPSSFQLMLSA